MLYFNSEILCSVSGFQMKAYNINFIYLLNYWKTIYLGKQNFTIKIKTWKKCCVIITLKK